MEAQPEDRFREICRRHDWKCTAQRRAVYRCLDGNADHPTAEMVCQAVRKTLPDVSLDSVYRILKEFAEAGIVRRLDGAEAMRFDPKTDEHDHYLCTSCGKIIDFHFLDADGVRRTCSRFGTTVSVELHVRGVCRECAEAAAGVAAASHM